MNWEIHFCLTRGRQFKNGKKVSWEKLAQPERTGQKNNIIKITKIIKEFKNKINKASNNGDDLRKASYKLFKLASTSPKTALNYLHSVLASIRSSIGVFFARSCLLLLLDGSWVYPRRFFEGGTEIVSVGKV